MNRIDDLNLNLLRILVVVLEERNLTRAGAKIGLSQSAISHAVSKLRDFFDDELVFRSGNGVILSAKAERLREPVKKWLNELESILSSDEFNPQRSTRTFVIACLDVFEQMIAPRIVKELRKKAPGIRVHFTRLDHRRFHEQLTTNEVDLAVGIQNYGGSDVASQTLYKEQMACMARNQHPILTKRNSLRSYVSYPHIVVGIGDGMRSPMDKILEQEGLSRELKYKVSNFSSAPYFVEGTDVVLTGPRRFLELCAKKHRVTVFAAPVKQKQFSINMYWAQKFGDEGSNGWLRKVVAAATADI